MTPQDRYRAHATRWTARRAAASARATTISRLRLLSFFAGVILLVGGLRDGYASIAVTGAAAFAAFAYLVVRHARVLAEIDRADAGLAIGAEGLARLVRDWNALPEIAPPADLVMDRHPYARDLDLYGRASLTKWLGRTATRDGATRLASWLLAPAGVDTIRARQTAIDELAAKDDWRESLGIEGRLSDATSEELTTFLEWAESDVPAFAPAIKLVAFLLPPITWGLLVIWLVDAIGRLPPLSGETFTLWLGDGLTHGWWLLPVLVNVVLSFASARRVTNTYSRVSIGERALERFGAMFEAVCHETWTSPELARLAAMMQDGESAAVRVRRLARLTQWSELRSGAALLHVVIQALTLWDFHLVFALERWRTRSGRRVRGWLDALGSIDALAVLSTVRADEPQWAIASVDPSARDVSATALGHPLMADDRRVCNDVRVGPPGTLLFVTGSNMSGKSTLLRAIGLNTVLATAGAPVCAESFRLPLVSLYTSIRVEDSLELGVSYFMAALARLKQIVDAAEHPERVEAVGPVASPVLLYLLDEILQGTNSIERAVAVCAVARHLLHAGAIGAMTSHDLTLADEEPVKSAATLVHFTEQVHPDGTMTFDYRLRPGLATSRNAIRLMQLIGITAE
jgi:MutS-like protein